MKRGEEEDGCSGGMQLPWHGARAAGMHQRCPCNVEADHREVRVPSVPCSGAVDEPGSRVKPTGVNIKRAINRMIDHAEPGMCCSSIIVVMEQGSLPGIILDRNVDFRQLVNRLPKEVSFTIISDSCHSGGLIDKEKEEISPSSTPLTNILHRHIGHHHRAYTTKSIPYESILQPLATLTSIVAPDISPT
ncbi:Metacaspase-9-like protein [Drosera capensis]